MELDENGGNAAPVYSSNHSALLTWKKEKKIKVEFLKYKNKYVLSFHNIMSNQVVPEMFQDG